MKSILNNLKVHLLALAALLLTGSAWAAPVQIWNGDFSVNSDGTTCTKVVGGITYTMTLNGNAVKTGSDGKKYIEITNSDAKSLGVSIARSSNTSSGGVVVFKYSDLSYSGSDKLCNIAALSSTLSGGYNNINAAHIDSTRAVYGMWADGFWSAKEGAIQGVSRVLPASGYFALSYVNDGTAATSMYKGDESGAWTKISQNNGRGGNTYTIRGFSVGGLYGNLERTNHSTTAADWDAAYNDGYRPATGMKIHAIAFADAGVTDASGLSGFCFYDDKPATREAVSFDVSGTKPTEALTATLTGDLALGTSSDYDQTVGERSAEVVKLIRANVNSYNVFGGWGSANTTDTLNKDVWIDAESGAYHTIVGGSWCSWNGGTKKVVGNVVVQLAGTAVVDNIVGADYQDAGTPNLSGNVNIVVKDDAVVKGGIIGGGIVAHKGTVTLTGNSTVTIKNVQSQNANTGVKIQNDNTDFTGYIAAGGSYGWNAGGTSKVTGSTAIVVDLADSAEGTFVKNLVGGGLLPSGGGNRGSGTPSVQVQGSSSVTISAPAAVNFTGTIVAGGYKTSTESGSATVSGTATLTLNGGNFSQATLKGGTATGTKKLVVNEDATSTIDGFNEIEVAEDKTFTLKSGATLSGDANALTKSGAGILALGNNALASGLTLSLAEGTITSNTGDLDVCSGVIGKGVRIDQSGGVYTYSLFDAAATYNGRGYDTVAEAMEAATPAGGTVTLLKPNSVALEIPENIVVETTSTASQTGAVSGQGTIIFDGYVPATSILDGGWTGTIWLKNIWKGHGYMSNYFELPNFGSASSTFRVTNVRCYLKTGATYNAVIDLVDEGSNAALIIDAGGSDSQTKIKLSGSGTIKNVYNQDQTHYIDIVDATAFTGSIDATRKVFVIGSTKTGNVGQIVVESTTTATVGSGSIWTAPAGLVVNGTITGAGTIASKLNLKTGAILDASTGSYLTLNQGVDAEANAIIKLVTAPTAENKIKVANLAAGQMTAGSMVPAIFKVKVGEEVLSGEFILEAGEGGTSLVARPKVEGEPIAIVVENNKSLGNFSVSNGAYELKGRGGFQASSLSVGASGTLVLDPIRAPLYITSTTPPTFTEGAKIKISSEYAGKTGAVMLMAWDGETEATLPDNLFDEETYPNAALSFKKYTSSFQMSASAGVSKTITALMVDLDTTVEKRALKVMPLGDSITEGTNQVGFGNPNYRMYLLAKLALEGYDVKSVGFRKVKSMNAAGVAMPEEWCWHNGVSGQRLVSAAARAGWRDALEATLDASEIPDVITFKIGTNDQNTNVDQLFAEWVEVMKRIIVARPATKIIVGSIMDINGSTWEDGWNTKIKNAVETNSPNFPQHQVFFADLNAANPRIVNGVYAGTFYNSSDLHPNWIGHEKNAECWKNAILDALADGKTIANNPQYQPNILEGAEANVGQAYKRDFTHLRTYKPSNSVSQGTSSISYAYSSTLPADTQFDKIAYYMELKNTRSGNVRWVWVDMDNWSENKTIAEFGIPYNYAKLCTASNIHIDTNDGGIQKVEPGRSGVEGWIQFGFGSYQNNVAASGAPAAFFTSDWNDNVLNSGSYGAMNIYRKAPVGVTSGLTPLAAQTLMAYSRFNTSDQEIGIGNCAIHGTPLVANNRDTSVNYFDTYQYERLDLASYELASIEIWGKAEDLEPVATVGSHEYVTYSEAVEAATTEDLPMRLINDGVEASAIEIPVGKTLTIANAENLTLNSSAAFAGTGNVILEFRTPNNYASNSDLVAFIKAAPSKVTCKFYGDNSVEPKTGSTLDFGVGGVTASIQSHIAFASGKHTLKIGVSGGGVNLATSNTWDSPVILVDAGAEVDLTSHYLSGYSNQINGGCVIRVNEGGTLNMKKGTDARVWYPQSLYLEPGATLTHDFPIATNIGGFGLHGGIVSDKYQIYVPSKEGALSDTAVICSVENPVAPLGLADDANKGISIFVGEGSNLEINSGFLPDAAAAKVHKFGFGTLKIDGSLTINNANDDAIAVKAGQLDLSEATLVVAGKFELSDGATIKVADQALQLPAAKVVSAVSAKVVDFNPATKIYSLVGEKITGDGQSYSSIADAVTTLETWAQAMGYEKGTPEFNEAMEYLFSKLTIPGSFSNAEAPEGYELTRSEAGTLELHVSIPWIATMTVGEQECEYRTIAEAIQAANGAECTIRLLKNAAVDVQIPENVTLVTTNAKQLTGTITGNGTVIFDAVGTDMLPGWTLGTGWSGLVTIKDWGTVGPHISNNISYTVCLSNLGAANGLLSKVGARVKFIGVAGWTTLAKIEKEIILETSTTEGRAYGWKNDSGGSSTTTVINNLAGSGLFLDTLPANKQKFVFMEASGFEGCFDIQGKHITLGANTDQTTADGQVCIAEDLSVEISTEKTWTVAGGILVKGMVKGSGKVIGDITFASSAAIDITEGLLNVDGIARFGDSITVISDRHEYDLPVLCVDEMDDYVGTIDVRVQIGEEVHTRFVVHYSDGYVKLAHDVAAMLDGAGYMTLEEAFAAANAAGEDPQKIVLLDQSIRTVPTAYQNTYGIVANETSGVYEIHRKQDVISVTLNANGGLFPATEFAGAVMTKIKYVASGEKYPLETVKRDNYDFVGWFTADGVQVTAETVATNGDILYAHWKGATDYRVTELDGIAQPELDSRPPISIDEDWMDKHAPDDKKTQEARQEWLNTKGANGLVNWQSYVLGLNPNDANSKPYIKVDRPGDDQHGVRGELCVQVAGINTNTVGHAIVPIYQLAYASGVDAHGNLVGTVTTNDNRTADTTFRLPVPARGPVAVKGDHVRYYSVGVSYQLLRSKVDPAAAATLYAHPYEGPYGEPMKDKYDVTKDYHPTNIKNGGFQDTMGARQKGVDEGWCTTDTRFEVAESTRMNTTYNKGINQPAGDKFAEVNADAVGTLYQDLSTHARDVVEWRLKHAVRYRPDNANENSHCPTGQTMRVAIGAPRRTDAGEIIAATGTGAALNVNIVEDALAIFEAYYDKTYTVKSFDGDTSTIAFGNQSTTKNLYLNRDTQNKRWYTAGGVYIVPEGQGVSRFAFISATIDADPTYGNLLNDIEFFTLVGNMVAKEDVGGSVTITGFWGDTDPVKKLVVEVGGFRHEVDMHAVASTGYFTVTLPPELIGSAGSLKVYHENYPQTAETLDLLPVSEPVHDTPIFGMLRVDSTEKETIINVPWQAAADGSAAIKACDLVRASNLTEGDRLLYYTGNAPVVESALLSFHYDAWTLAVDENGEKYWQKEATVALTGDGTSQLSESNHDANRTVARGGTLFVIRPTNHTEPIYLHGRYKAMAKQAVTVTAGSITNSAFTLIAPFGVDDVDLNAEGVMTGEKPNPNDYIIIGNAGTILMYDGEKWENLLGDSTNIKIPHGQGVWYVSRGTRRPTFNL